MANVTLTPAAQRTFSPHQRKRVWLIACWLFFLLVASTAFYFIREHWPYRYREIKPMLEDDFAAQITTTAYRRTYFPTPGFVATGITLRRKSALNFPPIGHADQMVVQGRWSDLFLLRRRVQTVEVTGLHLVIPPAGSKANQADFPQAAAPISAGPTPLSPSSSSTTPCLKS